MTQQKKDVIFELLLRISQVNITLLMIKMNLLNIIKNYQKIVKSVTIPKGCFLKGCETKMKTKNDI